ncbi:hypothetical protein DL96DRAFT_1686730 [Flagelloscypha sp. PMI_526]|nr:hypothetical protein DL96DRAFT_1686730 [Flagelloscypha sp. PMI_526]
MAMHYGSTREQPAIAALALDDSAKWIDALSGLYILQEAASRRAFNMDPDLRGEDIRPCDMFDIIGGTGTGGLKVTIGQAIQSHIILERLFRSDAWNRRVQQSCAEMLNATLDDILEIAKIGTPLDSIFEERTPKTKNYRPRTAQNPQCSIREVLLATLSNQVQLPTVRIQEESFLSALDGFANPTYILVKELRNGFTKGTQVACLVNVGAGHTSIQPLMNGTRLLEDDISNVKGLAMAYISTDAISTRLDDLEDSLWERFGAVSIERLYSVAGKDGESRTAARLAKIEQHLDDTIFRDVNKWLRPVHQTSNLDSNIKARSGTTCQWLLANPVFQQWILAKHGLFWFHGLSLSSSFIIETLLARDDIYVAYYYFEFTNPATLSEAALLRSLLTQLVAASPTSARTLYQKHNNGGLQPQLSTLHSALNELVSSSSKPVFIVIDALDELPIAQRKYLLESLATLSSSCAHIMTTSREEIDIQRTFEGEDFELGVQGDLLGGRKWMVWPKDEIEMIRHLLNERADGQFRMVACQVDILQGVKSSEQLRKSLHSLPKSLSETYNYILEKIPQELRVQAHRLFAILSFASTVISINELSALLAVDLVNERNDDDLPVFREEYRFRDPLDVVDLGTSLVSRVVSAYDGTIHLQLAHASVKEHLLGSRWHWFSLDEDLAHGLIARSCLAVLSHFRILQYKGYLSDTYHYSRDYWYRHVYPNGSKQLLRQQQVLYTSFPWPYHTSTFTTSLSNQTKYPMLSAAYFGLFDLLKTLLNGRAWNPDILAGALVEAARSPQPCSISLQCCTLLVAHNANVNPLTNDLSPLQGACARGHLEVVQFLVEQGADVNVDKRVSETALQAATRFKRHEIVQFLVEKGADVNAVGGKYGTALQVATECGSLPLVQLLVENGADVNLFGGMYETALHAAARHGSLEIVKFLVEKGADVNAVGGERETALQAGARYGNLDNVQFLIEQGAHVNAVEGEHGTALQAAASRGRLEIVRFLVKKGADVNAVGGEHGTALQAATIIGSMAIVQFLVEKGAEVNAVGGEFGTALEAARHYQTLKIAQFLLEKGGDIKAAAGVYEPDLDIDIAALNVSSSFGSRGQI